MKNITLLILCCLHFFGAFGQSEKYILNPSHTDEIINKLEYSPIIYEVYKKDLTDIYVEKSMNKNNLYNSLQKVILKLEKESATMHTNYEKALIKHKKTNLITAYIKIFENSNDPMGVREEALIEGQNIADKYDINILVYANENIHPDKKDDYNLLRKNLSDFNSYLKKSVLSIRKNNPKPKSDYKQVDLRLNMLREKSEMIKKNKTVALLKDRIGNKKSFVLGDRVYNNNLSGSFEKVGNYKIIANDHEQFFENELVEDAMVKKFNISESHIALQEYMTLITHNETRKYYFVDPEFLKKINYTSKELVVNNSNKRNSTINQRHTIEYSLEKYESMIQECKELTKKLIIHKETAQKGYMTKTQFKDWKRDIIEAKLLNYRIDEFTAAYKHFNYPINDYVNREALNNYDDFSKILTNTSKNVGL